MKIEIRNRWDNSLIFTYENEVNSVAITVREALRNFANLSGANLSGANLSGADLSGADLSGANLSGANLSVADLSGADLRSADLSGADLRSADLRSANLRSADLSGANLSVADLSGANLSVADLSVIKADFYLVLVPAIREVKGLRAAVVEGRVDGSTYTGDCACLVGTLANVKHCSYGQLPGIQPDASRPIERLFKAIRKGDTPENNSVSAIVLSWIDEFMMYVGMVD